jgi:hypothetical protein
MSCVIKHKIYFKIHSRNFKKVIMVIKLYVAV